jgi:hypothetical protein
MTVRKDSGTPGLAAWCATVAIRGDRPVSDNHCDTGAGAGLHGAFIADCRAHELIAYGAVRPSVTVFQPRSGRRPILAVYAPNPAGVRFSGDNYLIVVDLREAHPSLVARLAQRTIAQVPLSAVDCSGLGVVGGF